MKEINFAEWLRGRWKGGSTGNPDRTGRARVESTGDPKDTGRAHMESIMDSNDTVCAHIESTGDSKDTGRARIEEFYDLPYPARLNMALAAAQDAEEVLASRSEAGKAVVAADIYQYGKLLELLFAEAPEPASGKASKTRQKAQIDGAADIEFAAHNARQAQTDSCSNSCNNSRGNTCDDLYGGNGVLRTLVGNLIHGSLKKDPAFRFSSAAVIQQALDDLGRAAQAYQDGNYLALADLAWECNLPTQSCRLRPEQLNREGYHHAVTVLLEERLLVGAVDKYHTLHTYEILYDLWRFAQDGILAEDQAILISCGMRCYNHFGQSQAVLQLGNQLSQIRITEKSKVDEHTSAAEHITTLQLDGNLLMAVALTDMGEYLKALQLARRNIRILQRMEKTTGNASMASLSEADICLRLGRAYSSEGCSLARLELEQATPQDDAGNRETPLAAFALSIQYFEQAGQGAQENIDITICHILHYACGRHDQKCYEPYAACYFHKDTPEEQGEAILAELQNAFRAHRARQYYAMYAFVKGVYTFYPISGELAQIFRDFEALPFETRDRTYPLSLIFMYLSLIDDKRRAQETRIAESAEAENKNESSGREENRDESGACAGGADVENKNEGGGRVEHTDRKNPPAGWSRQAEDCFAEALSCDEDTKDSMWNMQQLILARIQWIYEERAQEDRFDTETLSASQKRQVGYILYQLHQAGWKTMEEKLRRTRDLAQLLTFEEA